MKTILFAAFLLVASAGSIRISLWTSPITYLGEFPLGISQTEVFEQLSVPNHQMMMEGNELWVYEYGEGYGLRKYTFVFKNKKVINVRYNDQGSYNNITALKIKADNLNKPAKEKESDDEF